MFDFVFFSVSGAKKIVQPGNKEYLILLNLFWALKRLYYTFVCLNAHIYALVFTCTSSKCSKSRGKVNDLNYT